MEPILDGEIARLVAEEKLLAGDFRKRLQLKPKRGHSEQELSIRGSDGSDFIVLLRQGLMNALDFSAILGYMPPESTAVFRLRRYNGRSHQHRNPIEGETFYDFHIHEATERYQRLGAREDTFARPTDRYSDLSGAIECLLDDCGFIRPEGDQLPMFGTGSP